MVILIMIDGTRPDALDQTECPNLKGLIQRGSSTMTATSVMPSITLPCHMSIFHSVPPTRHGITANLYLPMARPLPGLIETLRSAGKRSAFVYNWEPLRDLARPENISYAYYREPPLDASYDDAVGAEAVRLLQEEQYDFLFIYFGSIDTAGHAYGWMSPEYLQQIGFQQHAGSFLVGHPVFVEKDAAVEQTERARQGAGARWHFGWACQTGVCSCQKDQLNLGSVELCQRA